jgi:hypothetical protein
MPAQPLPGLENGLVQEIAFDLYDAVGTRDRLPPEQTEARNAAAFVILNSLAPTDPLQAMLASQAVALHYAAMACFRRANETETAPDPQTPRLHHSAVRLINTFAATIHRLQTLQTPEPHPPARKHPMQREAGQTSRSTPADRQANTAARDKGPGEKDWEEKDREEKEFSPSPCGFGPRSGPKPGGGVEWSPCGGVGGVSTPPGDPPVAPAQAGSSPARRGPHHPRANQPGETPEAP